MFVATFYSYKGGVGRTLALMNVAAALAERGQRVLIVDFDLEAPGFPSFEICRPCADTPGVTDYVLQYLQDGKAPDVQTFIKPAAIENVWIMPAGAQSDDYAARLAKIDWGTLYEHHSGFLMFEDMKAQWKNVVRPHYVLIDARTGHNDIGGICTRQLPDAVVCVFLPNEENINGIAAVAKSIRNEGRLSGKQIDILPVASRLPRLDDEYDILREKLSYAKEKIGYEELSGKIYHYDSMTLLNQEIFTLTRKKTRLAKEYHNLCDAIARNNVEDAHGVELFLDDMLKQRQRTRDRAELTAREEEHLSNAVQLHSENASIIKLAADIRYFSGEIEDARDLVQKAWDLDPNDERVQMNYVVIHAALSEVDKAVQAAEVVLKKKDVSAGTLRFVLRFWCDIDPKSLLQRFDLNYVSALSIPERIQLVDEALISRQALPIAQLVMADVLSHDLEPNDLDSAQRTQMLVLIATGRFEDALRLYDSVPATKKDVAWAFNRAMAAWGSDGTPNKEMFASAVALMDASQRSGPNYALCMAIAHAVIGDRSSARKFLLTAGQGIQAYPRRVFSPWRYTLVSAGQFADDIDQVGRMVAGENILPPSASHASERTLH